MRILLAILICTVFVGGTALYLQQRARNKGANKFVRKKAVDVYAVEITATLRVEPDAFSLEKFSMLLKLDGKPLLERKDRVEPGTVLRIEPVLGIVVGENEFFFEANPPDDQINQAHAVRIRIFRDGECIAEHSLWSDPGTKLATTFRLKVAAVDGQLMDHGHAH